MHEIDVNDFVQMEAPATAELYRLAALLYLYSVCTCLADDIERAHQFHSATQILRQMAICTSPWPLFLIACEVTTDAHRLLILDTLDRMDELRNIGNVFVVRRLIETYWKQLDLRGLAHTVHARPPIWDFLEIDTAAPWFV